MILSAKKKVKLQTRI